jgi:membrane-associated protease RseP (regulator of RpoE activity)
VEESAPEPPRAWETRGRFLARRRWVEHPLFHLLLLLLTFVSTTIAGGLFTPRGGILGDGAFADGIPFSIPVLIILGVHEMGHYLMCRRYGIAATLPYFIPSPLVNLVGTFGAVIRIKEPIRRKTLLLDIGAAGPLAGFVASLPFLFYGVAHPRPSTQPLRPGTYLFEYPLLVRLAQDWLSIPRYTSATVHEHPTFMAAWFGLLVTALNLLPIGQLDGGHVLRAGVGRLQPFVSAAVVAAAFISVLWVGPLWAFFALVATAFTGLSHPPTEDDDQPLGTGRLTIALLCLAVFLLCFSPSPIKQVD